MKFNNINTAVVKTILYKNNHLMIIYIINVFLSLKLKK